MDTVSIEVYDNTFTWQGTVSLLMELTAHRRHLEVSTAEFTIAPDDPMRPFLTTAGSQAVILLNDEPFLSGWVVSDAGTIDPSEGVEFELLGHETVLWDVTGWPVPGNSLSNQNVGYWRQRGPGETVVKAAAAANFNRLGMPVTAAADQGRGGTVDVSIRFHPLMERIATPLFEAGLGVRVSLVEGQGLELDVYEVREHEFPLDPESGTIVSGAWRRNRPTLTRVVAGTQGEAEARTFYGPRVAGWEGQWEPRIIEGFVDARDVSEDGEDPEEAQQEAVARMSEALTEGRAEHELQLELDSTPEFAYRDHWREGDIVPLQPIPDVELTATISEAELTITDGVRVRPVVGAGDDPVLSALTPLISSIRAMARSTRLMANR